MLFSRESLLPAFGESFDDNIRPALPTVAEPAWFAPPVDVRQDKNGITIVFDVGDETSDVRVEASGRNLYLWGPRVKHRDQDSDARHRAMRVFALPVDVARHDIHTARTGAYVRVRIAKTTDRVFPSAASQAA
jgi:HSP20 family molecular chaperone IbpA